VPSSANCPTSYPSASPRQITGATNTSTSRSLAASKRSRWGCNTCRKRKVKCDEGRPICGHCIRLNLVCDYDPSAAGPREYTPRRQQKPRRESGPAQQRSSPIQRVSPSGGFSSPWANNREQLSQAVGIPCGVNTSRAESVVFDTAVPTSIMPNINSDEQVSDPLMQLSGPDAWELELLGEDSLWANLPIFANFMSVKDLEPYGYVFLCVLKCLPPR
jgi:Fungal Zn(2)-Cys(6) binuclear cluster domain